MLPNSEKDFLKRHIGPSKEDQSKMLKDTVKADKFIEVDAEVAAIFNNASSISLNKGSAHSMLQL